MQPFRGNVLPTSSQPLTQSRPVPRKRRYWATSLHGITFHHHENLLSHIGFFFFFALDRDEIKHAAQTIYINIPATYTSKV